MKGEDMPIKDIRYLSLVEQACEALFVHKFDGRFIEVNQQACESLGYTKEELLRMSVTDIEQDFNLKNAQAEWVKIEPGMPFTLFGHQKRKDGTIFPVEIRFACFLWKGEKHFQCIVRDITEKRQDEERFRKIVESAPDPIFIRTGRNFAYINPAACQLFGVDSPYELIGTPVLDRIHPENREEVGERIRRLNIERKSVNEIYELRLLRSDGSAVWTETKGEPIVYEGREGSLVFIRDISRRKAIEEAIRKSEKKFSILFNRASLPATLKTLPGNTFIDANDAWLELFGYKKEEVLGRTSHELGINRDFIQKESLRDLEQKVYTKSGKELIVLTNINIIEIDGLEYAFTSNLDITERKHAEEKMRESKEHFHLAFEYSAIGMCIIGLDGRFINVNKNMCEIFGYSKEEMYGKHFNEVTYADDYYIGDDVLHKMLSGEIQAASYEKRYLRRSGKVFWANVTTALLRDGLGRPMHFIAQIKDITEHIEMEQELREAQEALRKKAERLQILHEIDQAIRTGLDKIETIAETALRGIFKLLQTKHSYVVIFCIEGQDKQILAAYSNGEKVAEDTVEWIKYADADISYADLGLLAQGKVDVCMDSTHSGMTVPMILNDKLIGVLNLSWEDCRIFKEEETEIAYEIASQLTLAIEQIRLRKETERYAAELEQRVKERTAQFETVNKELEAFSYSVSHDLRAPLRAVNGYVQILLEDYGKYLDAEGKRICSVISESARQMGRLIDDLLAFSRVGRAGMQLSKVDMGGLAKSIFYELTSESERKKIECHIADLPVVPADPSLIRQVWMNLLSNAIKFSSKKEKTVISVTGKLQEDEVIYAVTDYGAGFDMQYAGKLFGVFQRLHSAKEFEGTGVGLAIVQRIIQRHGGRVWAEGEPDKGATFYFSLKKEGEHAQGTV